MTTTIEDITVDTILRASTDTTDVTGTFTEQDSSTTFMFIGDTDNLEELPETMFMLLMMTITTTETTDMLRPLFRSI